MKILKYPAKELFKPCKEVSVFGPELKVLLDSMYEIMSEANGVGLAANQVGLTFRMFTMTGPNRERLFLVNPEIMDRSTLPANHREGCLSAPGEFLVLTERVLWVRVKYQDETGQTQIKVFNGLHSVCVQHEIDHLNGKSHLLSKSLHTARRKELAKKWGIKLK